MNNQIIKLNKSESSALLEMVRECVERGMIENNIGAKKIEKLIYELTHDLNEELPDVKIMIEKLDAQEQVQSQEDSISKRERMIAYCKDVKTNDMDHLQNCQDNLRILKEEKDDIFEGCPDNYGLNEYEGLCFKDSGLKQDEMCREGWRLALEN